MARGERPKADTSTGNPVGRWEYRDLPVDERRRVATRMYLKGMTQREIGKALGVTQQLISFDLKAVRKQWREDTAINMDEALNRELARIDALELTYWEAWENSQGEKTRALQRVQGKTVVGTSVERESSSGNPRFLEGVMSCISMRSKLLGMLQNGTTNEITISQIQGTVVAEKFGNLDVEEKRQLLQLQMKAMDTDKEVEIVEGEIVVVDR